MKSYLTNTTLFITLLLLFSACATSQQSTEPTQQQTTTQETEESESLLPEFEPVESSILDNGRMWTFEYAPVDYFAET